MQADTVTRPIAARIVQEDDPYAGMQFPGLWKDPWRELRARPRKHTVKKGCEKCWILIGRKDKGKKASWEVVQQATQGH